MPSLTADDLIACYASGVFPMAEARADERLFLVDPQERGVLPLERFHVPRRLARTIRADVFDVAIDAGFAETVAACATARTGREETWINGAIEGLYADLYARGLAHSVECRLGGELVGGLYGVALGGAFFGESMFSIARDASKVALVHLIGRLVAGGYRLLDTQFLTDHLAQFGVEAIARADYRRRLAAALPVAADFYALAPGADGASVLQAINQRS